MATFTYEMSTREKAELLRRQLLQSHPHGVGEVYQVNGYWCVDYRDVADGYGLCTLEHSAYRSKEPKKHKLKHGSWYAHKVLGCRCWTCRIAHQKWRPRHRGEKFNPPKSMASPNTLKIMRERKALNAKVAKIVTIDKAPGPNRAERRKRVGKLARRIERRNEAVRKLAKGIAKAKKK